MRLFSKTLAAFSLALLTAAGARADSCQKIDTLIATHATACASATTPLCTVGTIFSGPLAGSTSFTALTIQQPAGTAQLLYTGELVITTAHGTITIHDYGVFNLLNGKYSELQQIVSGTRRFKETTGTLISSGVGDGTSFFGTLTGTVCHGDGDDRGDHQDGGPEAG